MLPTNDMLTPATKADLRDAVDNAIDMIHQDLSAERLAVRAETHEAVQVAIDKRREAEKIDRDHALETWAGAIQAKVASASKQELRDLRAELASKRQFDDAVEGLRAEMKSFRGEFAAFRTETASEFAAFRTDLPPRVARLEAKAFPPRRTRRR